MNIMPTQSPKQFYRRELPPGCIEFSSEEGKQIFKEALASGHMDCYFKLAAQFRTQDEPAFCGLSTLVMVLNSLSVDPGRVWKGPWRWYHESMLDCCTSLSLVEKEGITFDGFVCLAECNFLITEPVRAQESLSEDAFREVVKQTTKQDQSFLVISYSRKVLGQTGDGHFSPVGGYYPGRDLALVLDTARFKYPPHWVPVSTLFTAMRSTDPDTGKPRGYILLSRHFDFNPLLLFRISPQLSVTLSKGLSPELNAFMNHWLEWLSNLTAQSGQQGQEGIVQQAVQELLKWAAFLSETASILTSQLDVKCPELVSPGHLCVVKDMMDSVERLDMFTLLSTAVSDFLASNSKEQVHKVCRAAGVPNCRPGKAQCNELMKLLTPAHFFTVLLLSWPYKAMTKNEESNAAQLQAFADKRLEHISGVLQNEISSLKKQLKTILKLYYKESVCICKKMRT